MTRGRMVMALAVAVMTSFWVACRAPSWPPGGPMLQQVRLDNPQRAKVVACCDVDGNGEAEVREDFGTEQRIDAALPCGAWRVEAELGGVRWQLALPLHANAMRPPVVALTIAPPPDAPLPGFAWIPPGPAVCGDLLGVGHEAERPARVLDFAGFWLAQHEVTNGEFAEFLTAVGSDEAARWLDVGSRKCRLQRAADGSWTTDAPTLPVVTVTHTGAVAFCAHRTRVTGLRHRLPSEWEWEKAARGPHSNTFAYGDVYRQAAANQESGELRPVGSYAPNAHGVFDLTGNAFEWVADVHTAVPGGSAGDDAASYRVLRGGSFMLDGVYLRNSLRMRLRPETRADDVSFRVLLESLPQ